MANIIQETEITLVNLAPNSCDEIVSFLDPLDLDNFFINKFHQINQHGDIESLKMITENAVERSNRLILNKYTAMAVNRDLGFLSSSLERHGISITKIEKLEAELIRLSHYTSEVPRDNVNSYASRNPRGVRQRSYTNLEEERIFIGSVNEAMKCLSNVVDNLLILKVIPVDSKGYVNVINNAINHFYTMINSIVNVRKAISPQCFSFELRPYFPPIKVAEKIYYGPGGAQMIMILIDFLLYGSSLKNDEYKDFVEENKIYLPLEYRNIIKDNENTPSIIDLIKLHLETGKIRNNEAIQVILGIEKLINKILTFRRPHTQLAKDNMKIRPQKSVGSGGYEADILDVLLNITTEQKNELKLLKQQIEECR